MVFKLTGISTILFITTLVNCFALVASWQRRRSKGGWYFVLGMLSITLWTSAATFDYAAVPIALKIFFAKLEYLGYNSALAFFAAAILAYMGSDARLKPHVIWPILVIIPISNILLAWTNDFHGLLWAGFVNNEFADNVVIFQHGPGFLWVSAGAYVLVMTILLGIWQVYNTGFSFARRQSALLLGAILFPMLTNAVYLLRIPALDGIDFTSITFSVTGLIFLASLYGVRFLDLVPVARHTAMERMADAVLVLDASDRVVDFNQAAQKMLGIGPKALGTSIQTVGAAWPELITLVTTLPVTSVSATLPDAGSARMRDVQLTPLEEYQGTLAGKLLILRDVTERHQTEAALKESEEKFSKAFHASPDAIILSRASDGKLIEVNEGFSNLTGYLLNDVIGMSSLDLALWVNPQERNEFIQVVQQQGRARNLLYDFRTQAGEIIHCQCSAEMISLYGEAYILTVVHDVTEQTRHEAALREANRALQDAQAQVIAQQRQLAAQNERQTLARELHDGIAQLLSFVSVQAQAARIQTENGHTVTAIGLLDSLASATQEAQRDLRTYIQNLGNQRETPRQDFWAALAQYGQHLSDAYGFEVNLSLPVFRPETLASTAVEMHLLYILREALSNAQQHAGVKTASLTLDFDDADVWAVVEDIGVGLPAALYTGPERRKSGHFGLSIMRERASEAGGSLTIEPAPGGGTRVAVRLPRHLEDELLPNLRLLLVDDHPLFVDGLRNLLTARGLQVVGVAHDGLEAQELARQLRPDLIAMDIQMPRCDGLEATRRIRAELPEIKIVMLTTSSDQAHLFEALQSGASGYLFKEMSADEMLKVFNEVGRGEVVFSAEMAEKMIETLIPKKQPDDTSGANELTERQMAVLRLLAQGMSYKEIGARLYITERTIKFHMGEILARLQLGNRRAAIEYARRKGLV
jgi:PAS domain S-box-containing protein